MDEEDNKKIILSIEDVNEILSRTLLDVSNRKISPKRAQIISRIAIALSKNISSIDLQNRIDFLEQLYNKR